MFWLDLFKLEWCFRYGQSLLAVRVSVPTTINA